MNNKGRGIISKIANFVFWGGFLSFAAYFIYFTSVEHGKFVKERTEFEKPFIPEFKKIIEINRQNKNDLNFYKGKKHPQLKGKILVIQNGYDYDGLWIDSLWDHLPEDRKAMDVKEISSAVILDWKEIEHMKYTNRGSTHQWQCTYSVVDMKEKKSIYRGRIFGEPPSPPDFITPSKPGNEMLKIIENMLK